MEKGRIVCDDIPEKVGLALREKDSGMFLAMPTAMRVWAGVKTELPCPLTVRDGSEFLTARNDEVPLNPLAEIVLVPQNEHRVGVFTVVVNKIKCNRFTIFVRVSVFVLFHYGGGESLRSW